MPEYGSDETCILVYFTQWYAVDAFYAVSVIHETAKNHMQNEKESYLKEMLTFKWILQWIITDRF